MRGEVGGALLRGEWGPWAIHEAGSEEAVDLRDQLLERPEIWEVAAIGSSGASEIAAGIF